MEYVKLLHLGQGNTSWNSSYSSFITEDSPFFIRGGSYFRKERAGLSSFVKNEGSNIYGCGFRSVLVSL